jgi:hypothetical protein
MTKLTPYITGVARSWQCPVNVFVSHLPEVPLELSQDDETQFV